MGDGSALPKHIGIIMDGNGRWAQKRGLPRTAGHSEGLKAAKRIVKEASRQGIPYLSLYTFSTENWKRTEKEVSFLMKLIRQHLKKEMAFYVKNGIKVTHAGDLSALPDDIAKEIEDVKSATAHFTGTTLILAINYGGRDEIIRAVNRWHNENREDELTEEGIRSFLDTPEAPDPDLIIRTAGEQRLSNFLLWQSAYSEYLFTDKLWPDYNEEDLKKALKHYMDRDRVFGGMRK